MCIRDSTGIVTAQKFVGDGSSLTGISGSGGVAVQDEGSTLSTQASTLNFVGSGVVASGTGATKTITINTGAAQTSLTSGTSKVFINNDSTSSNGSFEIFLSDNTYSGTGRTSFKMYQPTANNNKVELFSDNTALYSEIDMKSIYAGGVQHRLRFSTNNSNFEGQIYYSAALGNYTFYNTYNGSQSASLMVGRTIIQSGVPLWPTNNNTTDLGDASYKWRQFHATGVNAGVVTATTFHGDGSNLTGISGGGTNVGITTNLSGTFTASAGSPSTINTFGYGSGDIVVEYTVFIKNGSNFQSQKLLAMRDGTTIHSTQFAIMYSSSLLVQLDATISSGNILLRATPETGVSGSTTYKVKREVM